MNAIILTRIVVLIAGIVHVSLAANNAPTHEDIRSRIALTENSTVWTDIDQKVSLLCKTYNSEKLKYCFWRKGPEKNWEVFPHEGQIAPGYVYYGKGFDHGECGITLEKVLEKDLGNWTCDLITELETLFGEVALIRWEAPPSSLKPDILLKDSLLAVIDDSQSGAANSSRSKANVTCCVQSLGKPLPTLRFELGSIRLENSAVKNFTDMRSQPCIVWTDAVFTQKQNGRILRCIMDHVSFPPKKSEVYDSVRVNVEFPPMIENLNGDNKIVIGNLEGGFDISAILRSNPMAAVKVIAESRDGKTTTEIAEHSKSSSNVWKMVDKISSDQVRIVVRILDVKKMSDGSKITLYATNMHGNESLTFTFAAEELNEVNLLYVLLFTGISILLLGIIIVAIVWMVRNRHKRLYRVKAFQPKRKAEEGSIREEANRASGAYKTEEEIVPAISPRAEGEDTIDAPKFTIS